MSNSHDRQQPAEFLVNSEGAEAEGLFDDLEIVLNAPDPRSRNRRAINSRNFNRYSPLGYDTHGTYEGPILRNAPACFNPLMTAPGTIGNVSEPHTWMGSHIAWQPNQPMPSTEPGQYNGSSPAFSRLSYGSRDNGFMFDPSRLFDATNTPAARDLPPYASTTPGFLQQYGRQSLPAGDLPLRSFDQYWQSEDEISDTEIEDGEYDADENGASSEDKSADGSSEVLTDPMDEGGKMEWKRPRFGLTKNVRRMFDKHGNAVGIEIECGFNKDLGHVESQPPYYVQYRRNYFNIKAKYLVITRSQDTYDRLYLPDLVTGLSRIVVALVMSIRGVIGDEDGPAAELRVFTPKRKDIGTPTSVRVRPSNGEEPGDPILYEYTTGHFDKERVRHQEVFFQRHQFRKATPNNGCRRREQQFHRVVVEVNAIVGTPETHDQQEITVASVASDLLVTRGRCPKSSEPYDKTNPHHSRRKPQTPDDRRKKKLKERATNEKKDSGRVRKVESSEAPLSGRTRSQWRNIAAHPTASPTVPTLTNDASSRTSTVARSSPELANRTQEHPYVPGHHQAMLGLGSIGQLPPLKEWTDPFEGDDHGDLFNGTAGSTEALHAEYQGSQRSSVEQLMMLSHSSLANTGNATAATGDPALNDRVDYTGLSLEAFQRYPQIYRRQQ